ncbi:MBL fold metallo-hydrolase [Chryseobacterium sp. Bi04]|uniref:MBL fold metallo-hydrolase n=1 Tax=Chryseobacterium sp. Bi04 TaxID=2822345 RepID=UPI001E4F88BB|nr:MBL fold metallo-hydrolase [Chryseobacterium sp. Bi04]
MKIKSLAVIGLYLFFTGCISAQTTAKVLQEGLAVLGDWEKVTTFEYSTNRTNIDQWQGYDFGHLLPEKDLVHLFYDIKGKRFLHHTLNHYPGGYIFDTYRLGRDSTYYVYDGIGSRTGKDLLNLGSASFDKRWNALLGNFPYFILQQLLRHIKDEPAASDGKNWIVVNKTSGGTEEYRFDKTTFLLNSITRKEAGNTLVQRFGNFVPADGLMIAGKSSLERNGSLVYADSLTLFKSNKDLAVSVFDFPPGYKPVTGNTAELSVKTVAKDVYLIENVDGDRNIMFVNMGDYIVLTEAPVSVAVTRSVLEIIHHTLPDIPVRYVHLSHFHNDHIAGIAELVKEGASVICAESIKKPVMDMLSETDNALYRSGKIVFSAFTHKKSLANGGKKLEFLEIPNSHAKGMSFLYLPQEKMIYQGDLLSLPADSYLSPAIAVTRELDNFILQKKLKVTTIIGHHGLAVISKKTFDEVIHMKSKKPLFSNTFEH